MKPVILPPTCVVALILLLLAAPCAVWANTCYVGSGGTYSFGSSTSFSVATAPQTANALEVAGCTGGLLNVLVILGDPPYLRATLAASTNGFQLESSGGDVIPYSAFADPGHSYLITPAVAFNYYQSALLSLLGLLGGSSNSLPMYFRTNTGANVAAGVYTDTFNIQWSWRLCNLGAVVCLGYTSGSGVTPITLTMTVTNACQINAAPHVSFGQAPTPDSFPTVTQSISVLCTKNLSDFSVGLGPGLYPSGGMRRMQSGMNYLQYNIYKPGGTLVWGNGGSDRVSIVNSPFNGSTSQQIPYEAKITANQPIVPTGHYTDTIVVDVSF